MIETPKPKPSQQGTSVNEREWGNGFHLVNGEEAAALRDLLNARHLVEALREVLDAVGALTNPSEFPNCLNIPEGRGLEILAALAKAEAGHG